MKILFFTPMATKTGSEKLLWYILKSFDRTKHQAALYCDQRGPLIKELPADVPFFTSAFVGGKLARNYTKVKNAVFGNLYEKHILKIHEQFGADVWYLNTLLTATMAKYARKASVKVIFHVHELESLLEKVPYEDLKATVEVASLVIVTSGCVEMMMMRLGVDRDKIKIWNPVIDFSEIKINPARLPQIKAKHQIPADAFVWVMSGSLSYQKGIDIFIQIARKLGGENIYFVWLGSSERKTGLNCLVENQIKNARSPNIAFLSPSSEDYYDYLNMADGFVLTSREEPFGMVMIEAAYLGKPIVAFDSGGPSEFFTGPLGYISENYDVDKIAEVILNYTIGEFIYDPVAYRERATQFGVEEGMGYWEGIIDDFVKTNLLIKS